MGKRWLLWVRNALVVLILGGLTVTGILAGTNITFNGASYTVPAVADASWGQNVTNYLIAIASGALQKTGGAFTLTQEVDFGSTYGLKSQYFKSKTSTIATTGVMRMGTSDALSWRNAANNADLPLLVDASNHLDFNGSQIYTNAASATANGYLASSDWTTFNAAAISVPNTRTVSTTAPLAGGGALSSNLTLSITQSSASGNGYLSSADWQTFNQMASGSQAGRVSTASQTFAGAKTFNNDGLSVEPTAGTDDVALRLLAANGTLRGALVAPGSTSPYFDINGNLVLETNGQGTPAAALIASSTGVVNFPQGIQLNSSPTLSGVATSSANGYLSSSDWKTFNTAATSVQTTRNVNTTAPLSGGGALSSDLTLTITQSGNAGNGYLSSIDWQAFNSISRVAATGSANGYLVSSDWTAFNSIARVAATGSANGYLVSSDWTAFNSIARVKATNSVNGYLASSDWTTFNTAASTSSRGTVSYEDGSASLTVAFTGANSTSPTWQYARVGKLVVLAWPANTGLTCSNAAFTSSAIPAGLKPATNTVSFSFPVQDNGAISTSVLGRANLTTAGVITIFKDDSGASFTASGGSCGWTAGSVAYTVN